MTPTPADAAWRALIEAIYSDSLRGPDTIASVIARHRPLIEAALTPAPAEPTPPMSEDIRAGAALASALMAANYGGDSGEDVDRLIVELLARGYRLARLTTEDAG
jgi:hypothetical protein